jgi:hypothetical protein
MGSLVFFCWFNTSAVPGVISTSNRNEYQGSKGGRCVRQTNLPPAFADCLEILGASTPWSPQGPVQACSAIDLPSVLSLVEGPGVAQWLSRCATSRTVPGSIPGGVSHWGLFPLFLPTKPCALRSTQPLKMSNSDFSWGKGGRCVWLTIYHHRSAESREDTGL